MKLAAVPLADFDADHGDVDQALTRAGLTTPTEEDFRLATAWWNDGRFADTPTLPHADHLHVFTSVSAAQAAAQAGPADCAAWPDFPGQHAITFAAVERFDLGDIPATAAKARWAAALVAAGALALSVRGLVEPAGITRAELRRRRRQYLQDVTERYHAGKMSDGRQEETLAELEAIENAYAQGGPPTLVDATVLAALNGRFDDVAEVARDRAVILNAMPYRQEAAFAETWLCSPVRAVPHLHDLPSHTVAYSGLPSLSTVGDADGALLGFTEKDRQPAYLSPTAASAGDMMPIAAVLGQIGSGKTVLMLYLADQFARTGRPQVIFDPKPRSDHTTAVLASGGRVASLDELINADGVLDPLRFAHTPDLGVEEAANMLLSVNPWGSRGGDVYPALMKALRIGVQNGATCIGQALRIAADCGVPREVTDPVFELAGASPMFRAMVGTAPDTPPLRVADGITLIKVGRTRLELPAPGTPRPEMTPPQRVSVSLVRMITLGSMSALAERDGVMHLDEAWVVLGAGVAEMDAIGRTARSLRVLPMLYTQKCTDPLRAGLAGYISRILILPIEDDTEARAACGLARLEPTADRIRRITAKARTGNAPNWDSMRSLRDPVTGDTLRGAVAIYCDLAGRAVPTEITVPPTFLALASTNPGDIDARRSRTAAEDLAPSRTVVGA